MMKYLLLSLLAFACCTQALCAEDKLSLPTTEIAVRAHDGIELTLYQHPASGNDLVLWIGGNGWHDRSIQLARDFAQAGIEVWQIDFSEALMQPYGSQFMRTMDAEYVADIIEAAQQRSGKRVTLFAQSYAAIPLLAGATLWRQRPQHAGKLLGAVLFSPDLSTALPALGKDPDYLPIARATNIPLMIYQGSLHGTPRQFNQLFNVLTSNNPYVFYQMLPGVTSVFYSEEDNVEAVSLLKILPAKMFELFKLFESLPPKASKTRYVPPKNLGNARPDTSLKSYAGNTVAQAIDLQDANGKRFKLDDYRGKVTVVNFWATWCPPCVEEIPSLNRLREQMQGLPFELISINYADSPAKIREFLQRVNVQFPVLVDPNGRVSQQWNVIGFPSTFVIGRDGKIRYGVNAAIHWDSAEVVDTLKALAR